MGNRKVLSNFSTIVYIEVRMHLLLGNWNFAIDLVEKKEIYICSMGN
ncbi:MAG: hypothetical protein K2P14_06200 [Anaeroplasmataceae bacterium]|nr:hypothetical protein [Anaeroplasmataceae bacterium]